MGGTGGGGWGHPQGAVHMAAARLGCKRTVVGQGVVGQGEVGGVTRRVLCTWQLLGLAAKGPWWDRGWWDRGRWVGSPAGCCAHGSC